MTLYDVSPLEVYRRYLRLCLHIIAKPIAIGGCPDNSGQDNSARTIRRGQFGADNSALDNSARQFVADNSAQNIINNFIENPALIHHYFSSIPPLFQQTFLINLASISAIFFINLASISVIFLSIPLLFQQCIIITTAVFCHQSLSLPFQQYYFFIPASISTVVVHQSRFHFNDIIFINTA